MIERIWGVGASVRHFLTTAQYSVTLTKVRAQFAGLCRFVSVRYSRLVEFETGS